jgi:hypothetical protein
MANKKALFMVLVDHVPQFEAYILKPVFRQIGLFRSAYESLRCLDVDMYGNFCVHSEAATDYIPPLRMRTG